MRLFQKSILVALIAWSPALAPRSAVADGSYAGPFDPSGPMVTVGAGAAYLGGTPQWDALFRVEIPGTYSNAAGDTLILARIKADFTAGQNGVDYIDVHFEPFGAGSTESVGEGDLTFLNADIQRNVVLDNKVTARFTLVGVHGAVDAPVGRYVSILLNGAIDLLGIGYSERYSDRSASGGPAMGAKVEAGLGLFGHLRVVLGEKFGLVASRALPDDGHAAFFGETRVTSNTYADLKIDFTRNIGLFSEASYNVYLVQDNTGHDSNSDDAATQFLFGVEGMF